MSNSSFDSDFRTIPFYQNHDFMLPFVGDNYESSKHKKLLLVGESSYMPNCSTIHHDIDLWYDNNLNFWEKLQKSELKCCDIRGSREDKGNNYRKRIDSAIRKIFPSVGENAFNEIASYNYFLRPADNRQNIKKLWKNYGGKNMDCERAIRCFIRVLEILKPDLFVLASSTVRDCAEHQDYHRYFGEALWDWTKRHGINYIYTAHPCCSHWNRPMPTWYKKAYGLTSCEFFCKWLRENWLI